MQKAYQARLKRDFDSAQFKNKYALTKALMFFMTVRVKQAISSKLSHLLKALWPPIGVAGNEILAII